MTLHISLLQRAFMPPGTPTFAELIVNLTSDTTLSDTRRRDMISGLRRVAKALERPLDEVPCFSRWLQPRIEKISPAKLDLTVKSWQNAVSDARAAMAHFGVVERRNNRLTDLTPEWQRLWQIVLNSGDKTLQPALSRFVYFLSCMGLEPDEVRDGHAERYREALIHNEISKSPTVAYRAAMNGWNLAVRRIPEWPRTVFTLTSRQVKITLPPETFPASFIEDLDQRMRELAMCDPLGDTGRSRALRPNTVSHYRSQLLRFASELVHSGVFSEQITGLDVLVDPVMAKRGLSQMLSRTGNKTTRMISEVGALLRNMGRTLGMEPDAHASLIKLAGRVAIKPYRGMTPKNRQRLRVLQDEVHQQRLLLLPERIFARPIEGTKRYGALLAREDAIAIALLLVCPVRIKNIAGIALDKHLHRPGDGKMYFVLEEDETKTGRPIEFEVPREVVRMIDRHLATRTPQLCPTGTLWLFPRRDGQGPIGANALSSRLSKRIQKEIGVEMNAHLFRHFAVMTWLDANPGSYEVARHLLGHSETSHTIDMYCGLEVKSATKAFADLIETKKGRRR